VIIEDIGMMQVLECRDVVFAFIANAVAMYNVGFFNSFLAVELTDAYGIKSEDMGYYFSILSFSYLSSAIIIPYAFKTVPRKLQFICCFAFTAVAMMLMGPSKLFGFP
jgi:predicted MFS family arabinose efflux permease